MKYCLVVIVFAVTALGVNGEVVVDTDGEFDTTGYWHFLPTEGDLIQGTYRFLNQPEVPGFMGYQGSWTTPWKDVVMDEHGEYIDGVLTICFGREQQKRSENIYKDGKVIQSSTWYPNGRIYVISTTTDDGEVENTLRWREDGALWQRRQAVRQASKVNPERRYLLVVSEEEWWRNGYLKAKDVSDEEGNPLYTFYWLNSGKFERTFSHELSENVDAKPSVDNIWR